MPTCTVAMHYTGQPNKTDMKCKAVTDKCVTNLLTCITQSHQQTCKILITHQHLTQCSTAQISKCVFWQITNKIIKSQYYQQTCTIWINRLHILYQTTSKRVRLTNLYQRILWTFQFLVAILVSLWCLKETSLRDVQCVEKNCWRALKCCYKSWQWRLFLVTVRYLLLPFLKGNCNDRISLHVLHNFVTAGKCYNN